MRYDPPLVPGVLLRRYQRFLADVRLDHGATVVAHVPNSGAMRGCSGPGSRCLVAPAAGPRRRLAWTLEQVMDGPVAVAVNTQRTTGLAEEALRSGAATLPGVAPGWTLRREVRAGPRSRLDLLVEDGSGRCWVEVKSVTWTEAGVGRFPDAVTVRGARHLRELAARALAGERAVLLYVVQRGDARAVTAAAEVDPAYDAAFRQAMAAGVRSLAVVIGVGAEALVPGSEIPVLMP